MGDALRAAVREGDADHVRVALGKRRRVARGARDPEVDAALSISLSRGRVDVVRALVRCGALDACQGPRLGFLLVWAARHGHVDVMRRVLLCAPHRAGLTQPLPWAWWHACALAPRLEPGQGGADPVCAPAAALVAAAAARRPHVVRFLLVGRHVPACDPAARCALVVAAGAGDATTARLLLAVCARAGSVTPGVPCADVASAAANSGDVATLSALVRMGCCPMVEEVPGWAARVPVLRMLLADRALCSPRDVGRILMDCATARLPAEVLREALGHERVAEFAAASPSTLPTLLLVAAAKANAAAVEILIGDARARMAPRALELALGNAVEVRGSLAAVRVMLRDPKLRAMRPDLAARLLLAAALAGAEDVLTTLAAHIVAGTGPPSPVWYRRATVEALLPVLLPVLSRAAVRGMATALGALLGLATMDAHLEATVRTGINGLVATAARHGQLPCLRVLLDSALDAFAPAACTASGLRDIALQAAACDDGTGMGRAPAPAGAVMNFLLTDPVHGVDPGCAVGGRALAAAAAAGVVAAVSRLLLDGRLWTRDILAAAEVATAAICPLLARALAERKRRALRRVIYGLPRG
jgi:hypothetical protein